MKRKLISAVLIALTVTWMGVIFSFSCENGGESAESSGGFIKSFISLIDKDFDSLSAEKQTEIVERYDHFVRKTAHFTIYAILGGLLYLTVLSFGCKSKKSYAFAVLLGAIYASSDELHQYFVPGRAGMVRDVLLDTCGSAFGALCVMGLFTLIMRSVSKRKQI